MEALNKLSVVGNTEQLKQSVQVAGQLRDGIVANLQIVTMDSSDQISIQVQIPLVQQLESALSALQVLVLDHAHEFSPYDHALRHVGEVATQLHEDLSKIAAVAQIALLKTDIMSGETDQESLKKSFAGENLTILSGQDGKSAIVNDSVEKEVELDKLTTEITEEPVTSYIVKSESPIVLEVESQLDDTKETEVISFEPVAHMNNASNALIVEIKQTEDETISAECIAVNKVETMALDPEISILMKIFIATEQQVAMNETKSGVVDSLSPTTGNFDLHNLPLTLIN